MKEDEAFEWAKKEVEYAKERLKAAELLLKNGKIVDSINRSYYAMFHAARGFLFLFGEEPKTHEGVIREFSRIIMSKHVLNRSTGRWLRQAFEARESGDYRIGMIFEIEDAKDILQKAKKFVKSVEDFVKRSYKKR